MPGMGFIRVDRAFGRQDMEWGQLEIAEGIYRPAILPVGAGVTVDRIEPRRSAARQRFQAGDTQQCLPHYAALCLDGMEASIAHPPLFLLHPLLFLCRPR